ncbi:MAG: hypothetical protein QOI35_3984 [Cryptosporangiaceae bacterium]|jgi:hypothetical protein|nr:hypothetical protein [Cryptosporangiaceae bacterium]MDQ1658712.1 hypothetical protein [Cryptosporangiaceae bacterium]
MTRHRRPSPQTVRVLAALAADPSALLGFAAITTRQQRDLTPPEVR